MPKAAFLNDFNGVFNRKLQPRALHCCVHSKIIFDSFFIVLLTTDPMVSVSRTTVPASGYTLYGNSSYAIGSPKMTWEEARKKCHSENAELASILDPYSQSFLWLQVLKYGEPMWIGLNSNVVRACDAHEHNGVHSEEVFVHY